MRVNVDDIRRGMAVVAVDGEQIGRVVEVQPPTVGGHSDSESAARTIAAGARADQRGRERAAGGGMTTALDDEAPPRPGYILVQDHGVLGVDARRLHLPFGSVIDVVPGQRITINCTRDDAAQRYGHGPSLEIDEDAAFTPF